MRGGEGGEEGGKRRPAGVPAALACGGVDANAIVVAAVAGPLLPANAAKGRGYSVELDRDLCRVEIDLDLSRKYIGL